jgi:hypothetical protein
MENPSGRPIRVGFDNVPGPRSCGVPSELAVLVDAFDPRMSRRFGRVARRAAAFAHRGDR